MDKYRNSKKSEKATKQKKKTGDQNTKEKYKQLKHHTQKITRQSYWKYIENIVTPKEEEPYSGMKKFWTYIKHKRKDNIGISSLMMDVIQLQNLTYFTVKSNLHSQQIINSRKKSL
jgi:hypothetical protein